MDVSEKKYGIAADPVFWLSGSILLASLFGWLPGAGGEADMALSSCLPSFANAPWTLLSYAFAHDGAAHLVANLIGLYIAGRLLGGICSRTSFIALFFAGILSGAIFFLSAAMLFPAHPRLLAGASAGVLALLSSGLLLRGKYLFFILLIVAACLYGSSPAHLGGCAAGCVWYAVMPKTGKSVFADLRIVRAAENKKESLLCKVASSGYDALSEVEKSELDLLTRKKRNV